MSRDPLDVAWRVTFAATLLCAALVLLGGLL